MSFFSEEKDLNLQSTHHRIRKARKLIPRNSKVFPKDFFSANCDLNTEPSESPLSVATPKHSPFDSAGRGISGLSTPISSDGTPQRVYDQVSYWRPNKDSSSSSSTKLKEQLAMHRPVQSEHKIFKDITNLSYDKKSLSDGQDVMPTSTRSVAPFTAGLGRRRYNNMPEKENNIFFSITESDENNCQQMSPRAHERAVTEEQMQRTPVFKFLENNLPAIPQVKREVRAKKLVFEQDKWNGQGYQYHGGVTQSVSNLVLPLRQNQGNEMNMLAPIPMRHQRGHRRSDLIGLNVKIELINNTHCNEKRGFLPSLIKS